MHDYVRDYLTTFLLRKIAEDKEDSVRMEANLLRQIEELTNENNQLKKQLYGEAPTSDRIYMSDDDCSVNCEVE